MAASSRYEIVERIGQGGMGQVYRAIDRLTGRGVALKTLRSNVRGDATRRRILMDEATAAARLHHVNVVDLLDVGTNETGDPFLVMELLDGGSLVPWRTRWPGWALVVQAFDDVLAGLAAAHGCGVIHRDLKPENLLLSHRDPQTGLSRVKIADFGIARVADPLHAAARDNRIAGTPAYMAPEQLGSGGAIGPWTDLYAVGAMLYEFLSGDVPFGSMEFLPMIAVKLAETAGPLVPRDGIDVNPALATWVGALLETNARDRPRFACEVRATLREFADAVVERRVHVSLAAPATDIEDLPTAHSETAATEVHSGSGGVAGPGVGESTAMAPGHPIGSAVGTSDDVVLSRLREPEFAGRSRERAYLRALIDETCRTVRPRLLLLTGDAGIGKSRLARWGLGVVEQEGRMEGAAAGYDVSGTGAVGGLRHALTQLLGSPDEPRAGRATVPSAWAWLGASDPVDRAALENLARWVRSDVRDDATSTGDVASMALRALRASSRVRPVYLWLDDFGHSEDGAFELTRRLLASDDAAVLVVATVRSGTAEHPRVASRLDELRRHASASHLALEPLDHGERITLLQSVASFAPGVPEVLANSAGGNPLMTAQLVLAWKAAGVLVETDAGLSLAHPGAPVPFASADALSVWLRHRIDALLADLGTRRESGEQVLLRAACLGLQFEAGALRAASGGFGSAVDELLDRSLLHGIVRSTADGVYRFEHGLLHESLLARLAADPRRADISLDVAHALELSYGLDRPARFRQTADLLRDAGRHTDAVNRMLDAAGAASRDGDDAGGRECLRRVKSWMDADATPADDVLRARTVLVEGQLHYYAAEYEPALRLIRQAQDLFARYGDAVMIARAKLAEASIHLYTDRFADAERISRECLAFAGEHGPRAYVGWLAWGRLADLAATRGDETLAYECATRALEFGVRGGTRRNRALSRLNWADIAAGFGRGDLALEHLRSVTEGDDGVGEDALGTDILETRARVELTLGRPERARSAIEPRLADALSRGDKWRITGSRLVAALVAIALDPPDLAREATAAFLEAWRAAIHNERFTLRGMRRLAEHWRAQGDIELADEIAAIANARDEAIRRGFGSGP